MYRYTISFWRNDDALLGIDVFQLPFLILPNEISRYIVGMPDDAHSVIASCEETQPISVCWVAGYTVENTHGEN